MRWLAALLLLPPTALAEVPVTTAPLVELLSTVARSAPGTVVPLNNASLAAEISARIASIAVIVGDQVEPNTVLVQLDCRYHQAQLDAARAERARLDAQRRFASQQLRRARDLKRQKSISDELLEQRGSELDALLAQLDFQAQQIRQAEIQTERCAVLAPFRGVVVERLASVGELAAPGTPLLRLVQLDELEVSAELAEAEAAAIGDAVAVHFRFAGVDYPLRLRRLLPVIDEQRRTRSARFQFLGGTPPTGAAGRLIWRGAADSVPTEYLVRRGGRLGLFLAADGRARFHPLPNAVEGQPSMVDLPAGTRVIVEGRQGLNDGDAIQVEQ